jgi:hypothetical protein
VAQQLVPELDLSAFDLSPTPAYFHKAMQDDLDRIDGMDKVLVDIEKPLWLVDVVQIGIDLLAPITLADVALSDFETTNFTSDTDTVIAAGPQVDQGILNNETTAGKVGAAGSKLTIPTSSIAGVATGGAGAAPAPPPAPVLPAVGSAAGPFLAGAQAFITNVNRPGDPGHFHVGDPWQITIKAPAGSAIYAVASHNGVSLGQASFGVVPSSGLMLLAGKFTADQLGSWIENWYAGTAFVNQIVFEVK